MEQVYNFLDSLNINSNDKIIVAVSFGPDSMFLLDLLKNKFNKKNIICAHVHHNHRKESDVELEQLKDYCNKNDIKFEFMKIHSYKNNLFTEEEAREKRYVFFEQLIKKYNSRFLFTAHHGDDLIETVLMKIVRGSSIKGYSGINLVSKRNNYNIIRPLLYLTKKDILNYCNLNKIPYAVDNSNEDISYTRNRYRKEVLPFLKEENKNVHLKFLGYSNELSSYYEFVEKNIDKEYELCINNNIIDVELLRKNDDFIIKKIIEKYLFKNFENDIKKLNNKSVLSIINMINSSSPNKKLNLPLNKILVKSYNKIYFDNKIYYNNFCFTLNDEVLLPNGFKVKVVNKLNGTTNFYTAFNKDDIKLPLKVRCRKISDSIEILNLKGKKKIKDIFIDEKIPLKERGTYPVVVDSNNTIIWIPGLKKSKYDKSKIGNYDIILEYVKEDVNETK